MKKTAAERVLELQMVWKSGFHVLRILFSEGYTAEEARDAMSQAGYRSYIAPYKFEIVSVYTSEFADETSEMLSITWWDKTQYFH